MNEHGEVLGLNSQPSENIAKAVDIAHGRVPVDKHVVSEGSRRVKIGSFKCSDGRGHCFRLTLKNFHPDQRGGSPRPVSLSFSPTIC